MRTDNWSFFKIGGEGGLFKIYNSTPYHQKDVIYTTNNGPKTINYITRTKFDNGLKGRVIKEDHFQVNPKGTISFGAENADFFYQEEEYITGNKMYYIDTRHLNRNQNLFLRTVLQSTFTKNFDFKDGMIPSRIINEVIKLPSKCGKPDWEFIDKFMEKCLNSTRVSVALLDKVKKYSELIDISLWKDFKISELFEVKKGKRLTKKNMIEGDINYIGSSKFNNGVTAKIANMEHLHEPNTITVCYNGSVGASFFQEEKFWASDDVNVLYPKFEITKNRALFFATLLKTKGKEYEFNDKWKKEVMENDVIPLPVDNNDKVDYNYIDKFMKNINQKISKRT